MSLLLVCGIISFGTPGVPTAVPTDTSKQTSCTPKSPRLGAGLPKKAQAYSSIDRPQVLSWDLSGAQERPTTADTNRLFFLRNLLFVIKRNFLLRILRNKKGLELNSSVPASEEGCFKGSPTRNFQKSGALSIDPILQGSYSKGHPQKGTSNLQKLPSPCHEDDNPRSSGWVLDMKGHYWAPNSRNFKNIVRI